MNIKHKSNKLKLDLNVIKKFNIYHQYLRNLNQILLLEGYSRIKRSKYELEK